MEKIKLSAIDTHIISNIPQKIENKVRNKPFIYYGSDNLYPDYLWGLYNSVATLQSIINGTTEFVCGNDIIINVEKFKDGIINKNGDTIIDLCKKIVLDKLIFGGFAIQVIRNYSGEISELYYIDFLKIRRNENQFFFADD